jgi:NTE family protein
MSTPDAVDVLDRDGSAPARVSRGSRTEGRNMAASVAFLRNVPVLAGLPDELLAELSAELTEVQVQAGEWVMREGEAADSLFIVRSGRVEVIAEGPPEALVRVLRRGDVLGELALLRAGIRSASVRARRHSELLELGREAFEGLIQKAPSFALGLTRAMGAQLAASRMPVAAATPPRTIAVVGLDEQAPAAEVAEELADALSMYGSVARLAGGEVSAIDQAERDAERVVLRCEPTPEHGWTHLCVAEAHLVVAVSSGSPSPPWREHASALQGCELLVFAPAIAEGVLEALQPREAQVVADRAQRGEAVAAMARRLAGRSLGIVLSGGGARALAHLGVLEELRAAGLRFDRIAGVSLGSLVAATTAAGFSTEGTNEAFESAFVANNPSNDFVPPAYSLIRGGKTRRLLLDAFGDRRIEELPLRFFCLSCDLIAREAVVHRSGRLVDALYPSLAIPGVFPPVATCDGRLLVDGGVLDNLPVATMARKGEGPVIAVDVTGHLGRVKHPRRLRVARLGPRLGRPLRRALTGCEDAIPYLGDTIVRTITAGSSDTVAAARMHADLVITPQTAGIGLMDWKAMPRVVEIGRRAAREALAAHADLPSQLAG